MSNWKVISPAVLLCAALWGCASTPGTKDSHFCEKLDELAKSVANGQTKRVKLVRGGEWMIDHYKSCLHDAGDAPSALFCRWLLQNSSTEFMEANVNEAVSCLQGQEIKGYLGNNGISAWSGEMSLYRPKIDADVGIDVRFAVHDFRSDDEDFLEIVIRRNDAE